MPFSNSRKDLEESILKKKAKLTPTTTSFLHPRFAALSTMVEASAVSCQSTFKVGSPQPVPGVPDRSLAQTTQFPSPSLLRLFSIQHLFSNSNSPHLRTASLLTTNSQFQPNNTPSSNISCHYHNAALTSLAHSSHLERGSCPDCDVLAPPVAVIRPLFQGSTPPNHRHHAYSISSYMDRWGAGRRSILRIQP